MFEPVDVRGQLPMRAGARPYYSRPVYGITGITVHYTASSRLATVEQIAAYQTGPGAQEPFPAIAYHLVVDGEGLVYLCHDLATRCWHSGAVVDGIARNASHVGVCWIGDDTPTQGQILGLIMALAWVDREIGHMLPIEGHRDAPYPTLCPGATWPTWRAMLQR